MVFCILKLCNMKNILPQFESIKLLLTIIIIVVIVTHKGMRCTANIPEFSTTNMTDLRM